MSARLRHAPVALFQSWDERLLADRARAARNQTAELAAITREVEARCRSVGADGFVLTGSTARGRRTRVSDLDYHVIGARPDIRNLPEDIDLYCDEPAEFAAKLRVGDDFVHWSLRHGCILFDKGTLWQAAELIDRYGLWPDIDRKLGQARRTLAFAEQMIESGDYEAALEQTRGALSLAARWLLLRHDVFPLARDELSDQLRALACDELADALHRSIHERPSEEMLLGSVAAARALLELPDGVTNSSAAQERSVYGTEGLRFES